MMDLPPTNMRPRPSIQLPLLGTSNFEHVIVNGKWEITQRLAITFLRHPQTNRDCRQLGSTPAHVRSVRLSKPPAPP